MVAGLLLIAVNILGCVIIWPERSRVDTTSYLVKASGYDIITISNVSATLTAFSIVACVVHVILTAKKSRLGMWMVACIFCLQLFFVQYVGFWEIIKDPMWRDLIAAGYVGTGSAAGLIQVICVGNTLLIPILFWIGGGRFWKFITRVAMLSVIFPFLGVICLGLVVNSKAHEGIFLYYLEAKKIKGAIACMFFAGVATVAAILFSYLPCRCRIGKVTERVYVIILGFITVGLSVAAAYLLYTQALGHRVTEYMPKDVECLNLDSDWGRCEHGDDVCCTLSAESRLSIVQIACLIAFAYMIVFGIFALIATLRALTVEECCLPDPQSDDLIEMWRYDNGLLSKHYMIDGKGRHLFDMELAEP